LHCIAFQQFYNNNNFGWIMIGRQHYRLYTIQQIPSLKTLDYTRITKTERERAERLANSAAGAALQSDVQSEAKNGSTSTTTTKTFVPGEGESAKESFVTSFTKEQKEEIRELVANARSPAEIDEIERSVKRGIFPSFARKRTLASDETTEDEAAAESNKKSRV
jgi:hypothetical protein